MSRLTTEQNILWNDVRIRVYNWSEMNNKDEFNYGTRKSYFTYAFRNNVINQDELDLACQAFADLWDYTGD